MLTIEQLQFLGLEASHRAFAFEHRVGDLERQCQQLAKALNEAEALIQRLRKGDPPAASDATSEAPKPPAPFPAIVEPDDDDGVEAALDAMARDSLAVPA